MTKVASLIWAEGRLDATGWRFHGWRRTAGTNSLANLPPLPTETQRLRRFRSLFELKELALSCYAVPRLP